ncbi:tektin-1-like [Saccoglossus kowalevskii]|uniref:Tektin n=1 Tax=Saccoglossus kowalevskii TaxID=10224 RepID=A0ABM0GP19_SACKO|nr:PREDICTED: tektin-1-like [Saccoglossus kowalevskii]
MAKLITAPPRFTREEWVVANHSKYNNAEKQRASAERLKAESDRLIDETEKHTKKTQRDVNKKFEQRIDDINFWKEELDHKLDDNKKENDTLLAYKTRLENALDACREPLAIAQQCLVNREGRKAIDLVHDDVQKNLMKEVETIQGVMALLQKTLDQTVEQIRRSKSAKFYLEKDLKDKFLAKDIDDACHDLRDNTPGIKYNEGAAKIEANSVTPDDWQEFSNKNIEKAEREKNASISLRSMIDAILEQTADDMQRQVDETDLAFDKRITETKATKEKLEDHLSKVQGEILEMEKNIDKLQNAIDDKEGPMKLSQTRLKERTNRPNVELCRDPVQYRLIKEVGEITSHIDRLSLTHAQAESELKGLIRNQLTIEEDIDIKANTVQIDDVECMGLRKSIKIKKF